MLRITPSANAQAASGYHRSSLRKQGEYYKEEIQAFWKGGLADRLGLGEVTLENFDALVSNQHPNSKGRLTPLTKENRKAGWDLTVLPPKSFSVLSAFVDDHELESAFKQANHEMMLEAQRLVLAQANTQYGRFFEQTSNALWAEFHHKIGRPVAHDRNGETVFAGQPLEHIHNFLISATFSDERGKILAVDPFLIYKSAPYLQSYFHTRLSNRLVELGYGVERTQDAWEIKGISRSVIERFSERGKIIERLAEEKGITSDKEKSRLAALSRESKNKSIPENELLDLWKGMLSREELETIQNLKGTGEAQSNSITPKQAIDRSLEHFLERNSVAEEKRVLGKAMELSYGSGHSVVSFERELKRRDDMLYSSDGIVPILTTKSMVQEEEAMIRLTIVGKGKLRPNDPNYQIKRDYLNSDQQNAVRTALSSPDRFIAIEGKAGSGKSTLSQELADGFRANGKRMVPIAPSSQAVEVLRNEGFEEAQTIAAFLINPKVQASIEGQVLYVDEASFVGVPTMNKILTLGAQRNAKVILSGNISQHASPGEYGDALRILQQQAGIKTVHVQQNMRQKPADYKKAVDLIAKKRTLEGYQVLDQKLKAVQEIPDHKERLKQISHDYIESVKAKRSALIVSPTHKEGNQITEQVREGLRKEGLIRGEERKFQTLKDLSLSESEKKDSVSYQEGQVIRFIKNQKAKDHRSGFKAGGHYQVLSRSKKDEVRVQDLKTKQVLTLPTDTPKYFSVFERTETKLSAGDLIRPTVNLKSKEETKINNGTPQVVKGFQNGHIQLENGKTLDKDSFHFKHGYVDTSHSAQGKTCQDVYVSMSDASMGGITDQSFYVAASRGRSKIQLYTNSKQELKTAIQRSGERTSALQVAREHERRIMESKQRAEYERRTQVRKEDGLSRQRTKEATRDISGRVQSR